VGKLRLITFATLLIASTSTIFANSTELLKNTLPQTAEAQTFDLYSRPLDRPEKSPFFLSGSLLMLAPQIALFPTDTYEPGLRLSGGLNGSNWDAGFSYTYFGTSYRFDSEYVLKESPHKRLKIDSHFSFNDYESTLAIPYALEGELLLHTLFGIEYATTERYAQYTYKKEPLSEEAQLSKFSGLGPQLGLKLTKPLSNGLDLTGTLTQSLLKSRVYWVPEKFQQYSPVTKLHLGAEWSVGDDREKFFHLAAGYEFQYWGNEAFIDMGDYLESQDLTLQGFGFEAKLNF